MSRNGNPPDGFALEEELELLRGRGAGEEGVGLEFGAEEFGVEEDAVNSLEAFIPFWTANGADELIEEFALWLRWLMIVELLAGGVDPDGT